MSAEGVMPALFAEHERFGCWWLDVAVDSGLSCSAHDLGLFAPSGSAAFESRMITSISSNRFFDCCTYAFSQSEVPEDGADF